MSDGIEYLLWRHALADGEVTTLYAVRSTRVRVLHFPRPEHLDAWCVANVIDEAVVGGFFLRDPTGRLASCGSTAAPRRTNRWRSRMAPAAAPWWSIRTVA